MKDFNRKRSELTIGFDLGDRFSYYTVLDRNREVISEGRVRTRKNAICATFQSYPASLVVMEVGTSSAWVERLLQDLGHQTLVANARQIPLVTRSKKKTDRQDSEILARMGRADPELLRPIRHRSEERQSDLRKLKAREVLIRSRTSLINNVRSLVKSRGDRIPSCSASSFSRRARASLDSNWFSTVDPLLDAIQHLSDQIRAYDVEIRRLSEEKYPETRWLRQVRGVGWLTALAYVLIIEDPHRFRKSRQVGAYVGLCPAVSQSGDRDPQLRITRQGDGFLRKLLIHCSHYQLGPFGEDSDLRRHGEKISATGGKAARKRAVVAVARKLANLLHLLWVRKVDYEPFHFSGK